MFKKLGLISLAAAAITAMGVVACGDNTNTGTCTTDLDCTGEGEICHPDAQVCVKTCTSGSDCPSEAKTCGAISATDSRTVCQCATDQLCQTGPLGSTAVCSTSFKVCCDSSNTSCVGGGETDGGVETDGGMGACEWSTCSPTGWSNIQAQQCNVTTCGAGPSCSGTGMSTCTYGSFCTSGACSFPSYPTQSACSNFYSGSHSTGPKWSPFSSMGPVIYSLTEIGHGAGMSGNFTHCPSSATEWQFDIKAYRTDMDWPATRAGLSGFFYVTTNGTDQDIIGNTLLLPNVGYNRNTSNAKDADFKVYVCANNAENNLQPGFYFTGGNEACNQF